MSEDTPDMPESNCQTSSFDLIGARSARLHGECWLPESSSRAVVVLAHGKDEHSGRYRHIIEALTEDGYAVFAHDHRGHGRSDGQRGVIERFDDYVDDFDLLVGYARRQHPESPLFLLGHSMGGLIATRYALAHQQLLAGMILSGPAFLIGEDVPGWKKRALLLLGRVAPNHRLPPSEPGTLSRDPEVERTFAADPLCHNEPTRVGFARELYIAAEATRPRGAEVTIPLLIMHGGADTLTSPHGSEQFFRAASSTDKTLRVWPDNRHEIINDLDKETVIAYMLDWLNERTP
jgi:alpha-beta hydrolase superfamily lysophospholipase